MSEDLKRSEFYRNPEPTARVTLENVVNSDQELSDEGDFRKRLVEITELRQRADALEVRLHKESENLIRVAERRLKQIEEQKAYVSIRNTVKS